MATGTFKVRVGEERFDAYLELEPGEDARAVAELFPKTHRVKASAISRRGTDFPCVTVQANFRKDGVRGERNEEGERRVRNFARKARDLGYEFEVQPQRHEGAPPLQAQMARARGLLDHADWEVAPCS